MRITNKDGILPFCLSAWILRVSIMFASALFTANPATVFIAILGRVVDSVAS